MYICINIYDCIYIYVCLYINVYIYIYRERDVKALFLYCTLLCLSCNPGAERTIAWNLFKDFYQLLQAYYLAMFVG